MEQETYNKVNALGHEDNTPYLICEIKPATLPFITGLAEQYKSRFPLGLLGKMSEKNWNNIIEDINDELYLYWPCPICFYGFGLILGIFTFGISCIFPCFCINEARVRLRTKLRRINARLEQSGSLLRFDFYERFFFRSAITIREIRDNSVKT